MITKEKKRILRPVLALAVSAVTIASVTVPVCGAPSAKELEITTSDLKDDLDDMNSQLSSLSAELDNASAQIEELSADVEKAKLDLAAAQLNQEAQYESMKNRIKFMYEGGSLSLLDVLFSSENMGDFLNKAEYVTTISEYDRDMLEELNQNLSATILMVTHDSFTASYCRRILFIKDGKIFNEIHRGTKSRKEFFEEIMEVVSVLGGETNDRG